MAGLRGRAFLVVGLLVVGIIKADTLTTWTEEIILGKAVVHAKQTRFQRIVVTNNRQGFQLYLNGHLQFNSVDEYRYHEALVHPAMLAAKTPKRVLVLGGGDGLAVREILKYDNVESVTLVDIDPGMTEIATQLPLLRGLNEESLMHEKVTVTNTDAFVWVGQEHEPFDAVVIDFPDPGSYSVGKLYTTFFYRRLKQIITPDAVVSIQCTSPLVAGQSYWCILRTMEEAGFKVRPYCTAVPTFGVWGFALASLENDLGLPEQLGKLEHELSFLNESILANLFELPRDIQPIETEINQLNNQVLVRYYDEEWRGKE